MKHDDTIAIVLAVVVIFSSLAPARAASPAEMISDFRLQHGEHRVSTDPALIRIAREQAAAMAAKDTLDHDVLGRFSVRISPTGAGRAAENIAYGYDNFPKTLNQWIESTGHRKNLLLHDATRVGVASAKSSATGRTYWAMEIAGDYRRPKDRNPKSVAMVKPKASRPQACRLRLLNICL
ncbi:MAG: CAP domain-containing protein [Bradyrhizobium sp.]|nr:CAP domain-containing protein [Bradyrhizobium sp.]